MKVAVLYTGGLRTIIKTIKYLKQNVLLNSDVEVFACLQNDTYKSNAEWEEWIHNEIGSYLRDIIWFSPYDHHRNWILHREYMISHMNLDEGWKEYLKRSGSIIEYFQLYLAYLKMCNYEDTHYRFKYIIRMRPDIIITKPIDFHWLHWTDNEVEKRISLINSQLTLSNIPITPSNTLKYFMSTIISDDLINNTENIQANLTPSKTFIIPETATYINKFIKTTDYILTIRQNNLYICPRESFNLIPSLAYLYGSIISPITSPDLWFNAENQFRGACYFSGLTIFDYCTEFEDLSLEYTHKDNYLDSNGDIINPKMLWCIVRH
jgi:hypothetical protein